MTLRHRAMWIIGGMYTLALIFAIGTAQAVIMRDYLELERVAVETDVERGLHTLNTRLDTLLRTTIDYAYWDDTYQFARGELPNYVERGTVRNIFAFHDINLVVILDPNGTVIYSEGYESDRVTPLRYLHPLLAVITTDERLSRHETIDSPIKTLIHLGDHTLLLTSVPILTTARTGPSAGTMLWGLLIDERLKTLIEASAQVSLIFHELDEIESLPAVSDLALTPKPPYDVQPLSNDRISGHVMLYDINNRPVMMMHVEQQRSLYLHGQNTVAYFTGVLLFTGIVVGIGSFYLLERQVLSRLASFSADVGRINTTHDLSRRLTITGNDEVSALGRKINDMLAALEQSQSTLRQVNSTLSKTLAERVEEQLQRQRFYMHAAHELRTPLANFKTRLYLLTRRPERLEEHVAILDKIVDHMTELADDLMEISRLQRRKVELDEEHVSVHSVVGTAVETQQYHARQKHITIAVRLPADPVMIIADSLLLTQALETMLFNAITYADPNSAVEISLHPHSDADDKSLCIQIAFAAEQTLELNDHMMHIFEPFFRATEGDIAGSQVSMTIAKEIIEQHGGAVVVEPDGAQGFCFRVRVLRAPEIAHTPAFIAEPLDHPQA